MPEYTKLSRKEWKGVVTTANAEYKKLLGSVPTRANVRNVIENPYAINTLQYIAMFLVMALGIFTGFKVGALAIPFSNNLLDHLTNHAPITEGVRTAFNGVTFALFWLLSTPGLIYFKLLAHDEKLVKQREATANYVWYHKLSLEYVSPRLPSSMTYIIMIWLFAISLAGGGTIFEIFIPVLAELALAQLVGDILEQNASYSRVVSDRLKMDQDAYYARLRNPDDKERLAIVASIMAETMINLVRGGSKPNAFLENADRSIVKSVLRSEYERLTSIDNFITDDTEEGRLTPTEIEIKPNLHTTPATPKRVKRMTPPKGAKAWTHDTLLHALQVLSADPSKYNEDTLSKDFAPGYNATGIWRKTVRKEFTGN